MTSAEEATLRQVYADLEEQLRKIGLRIRSVEGDGNCFFRAVSDQINGVSDSHGVYRKETAEYMLQNKDDFKDFILAEDYEAYVQDLSQDGVYVDNDTVQAFARMKDLNVVVHQLGQAPIVIVGTDNEDAPEVHLTYVPQHYNSLRWYDEEADTKIDAGIRIANFTAKFSHASPRRRASPEPDEGTSTSSSSIHREDVRQLARDKTVSESRALRILESVKYDREAAERILDQEHTTEGSSDITSSRTSNDTLRTSETCEDSWTVEDVRRFAKETHSSPTRVLEVLEKVGYDEEKAAVILHAEYDKAKTETAERRSHMELRSHTQESPTQTGKPSSTRTGLDQQSSRLGLRPTVSSYRKMPTADSNSVKPRASGSRPTVSTSSTQTNLSRENSPETSIQNNLREPTSKAAPSTSRVTSVPKAVMGIPRTSKTSTDTTRYASSRKSEEKVASKPRAERSDEPAEHNGPRRLPRPDHIAPARGAPASDAKKDSTKRDAK